MRFGKQTTITAAQDGLIMSVEEKYYDWETVNKITTFHESVKVKGAQEALTHFLKLMDQHNAGTITSFGVECIAGRDGEIFRIEKSWVITDLT